MLRIAAHNPTTGRSVAPRTFDVDQSDEATATIHRLIAHGYTVTATRRR